MKKKRAPAGSPAKKKLILIVLLLVLGALWARVFLRSPKERSKAAAAPAPAAVEQVRPAPPASVPRVTVEVDWPPQLTRDPFGVDLTDYPGTEDVTASESLVAPRTADDPAMQHDLASLRLQSTMLDNEPHAVINGTVYRVGDTLNGFVIRRIEHRCVVMTRDDVHVELKM